MYSQKELRIREAIRSLWKIDATGNDIANFINAKYGTKYTGANMTQFMRYGVRGLEKHRPRSHNSGERITYRLVA